MAHLVDTTCPRQHTADEGREQWSLKVYTSFWDSSVYMYTSYPLQMIVVVRRPLFRELLRWSCPGLRLVQPGGPTAMVSVLPPFYMNAKEYQLPKRDFIRMCSMEKVRNTTFTCYNIWEAYNACTHRKMQLRNYRVQNVHTATACRGILASTNSRLSSMKLCIQVFHVSRRIPVNNFFHVSPKEEDQGFQVRWSLSRHVLATCQETMCWGVVASVY